MAAVPMYSDDKIVVDASDLHHDDLKSHSLSRPLDDKMVTTHDEKMLSDISEPHSDEKIPTAETGGIPEASDGKEALNVPAASLGKEAVQPGGTDDQIPISDVAASQDIGKIPADEFISPTTQRAPTNTSWASQTRSTSRSYREFSFHHTSWKLNHNIIVDPNDHAAYFAESSGFSRSREDVVLHRITSSSAPKGSSLTAEEGKGSPSVAFAQFAHRNPDSVRLALGTSDHMNSVKWFELARSGEADDWRLIMPNGSGSLSFRLSTAAHVGDMDLNDPETPASTWSTTGDSKASVGSFKLIDSGVGMPLASYTEQKAMTSWKKRGKLRLFDRALSDIKNLSEQEMEHLVILACAVLNEKRRRKSVRKWTGIALEHSATNAGLDNGPVSIQARHPHHLEESSQLVPPAPSSWSIQYSMITIFPDSTDPNAWTTGQVPTSPMSTDTNGWSTMADSAPSTTTLLVPIPATVTSTVTSIVASTSISTALSTATRLTTDFGSTTIALSPSSATGNTSAPTPPSDSWLTSAPTTTSSANPTPNTTAAPASSSSSSVSAQVAAGVLGTILTLSLIGVVVWLVLKRRRAQKIQGYGASESDAGGRGRHVAFEMQRPRGRGPPS